MSWNRLILGACCLCIGACSLPLVTTYGKKPRELAPGRYEFTLSYNADASDVDIDRKASSIVEKIRTKNAFEDCEFTRDPMVPPWRNKAVKVLVSCN